MLMWLTFSKFSAPICRDAVILVFLPSIMISSMNVVLSLNEQCGYTSFMIPACDHLLGF